MFELLREALLQLIERVGLKRKRRQDFEKDVRVLRKGEVIYSAEEAMRTLAQEAIRAVVVRLSLEKDPERRLSNIQTLASLGSEAAIPFAVNELNRHANKDVTQVPPQYYLSLLDVLGEFILRDLRDDVQSFLMFMSFGIDPNAEALPRYVPIRAYLSAGDPALVDLVSQSLLAYSDALGFEITSEILPIQGSWFKKWFAKTKEALSRDEVVERLEKAERALELAVLHKEQALVDRNQAEAAARLIESLANIPNAACQIGSILVAKVTDGAGSRVYTRSLSPRQMIFLEKNQGLLTEPQTVLLRLEEAAHGLLLEDSSIAGKG